MILFRPEHVEPILSGQKVQTRRIWKKWRVNVRSVQKAKTRMLSEEFFAKLYIYERWEERLGDITDEDARAEGYENREAYLAKFAEINKKALKKCTIPLEDIQVKCLKFVVVP